jgi:hypothetical protein|uniref:Uncharacterized protein n=1 Tax=Zea mays TaxID=4577 RepID=C0P4S6_MAIZE|nr:unknown [Zea mays]
MEIVVILMCDVILNRCSGLDVYCYLKQIFRTENVESVKVHMLLVSVIVHRLQMFNTCGRNVHRFQMSQLDLALTDGSAQDLSIY